MTSGRMKYLIFGNGYLGNIFHNLLDDSVISGIRVNAQDDVESEIVEHGPDYVLNCAGVTGRPNIDWCEEHKQQTLNGNVTLPLMMAKACRQMEVPMLHLGSGCIYEGDNGGKGFREVDPPNMVGSFYSKTKALCEDLLKDYDVLQLRLRMPIDANLDNERNFINKIMNYPKVISVKNSITIVEDLVKSAEKLLENGKSGVYNVVNPGPMAHGEILDLYREIADPGYEYEVMAVEEMNSSVKAPRSNCVLNTDKLQKEVKLPKLRERLADYFSGYGGGR